MRPTAKSPIARCAVAFSVAMLSAACEPGTADGWRAVSAPPPKPSAEDVWLGAPPPALLATSAPASNSPPVEDANGRDFIDDARVLYRVAACGSDGPLPEGFDAAVVKAHCDVVRPQIEAYKKRYVSVAKPFLTALLPGAPPEKVVYPFGGGDLVTALTTFPDAKEITTISLELCGDPRRVRGLSKASLEASLAQLRRELAEILVVDDYSRSETLKKTQRGDIPGELAMFLVGLAIHGYEPTSLRYFAIGPDGGIRYLGEREIADTDHVLASNRKATWWPPDFSESFANAEIGFAPVGGASREPPRFHRHIAQNLADEPLARAPSLLRHLEDKGPVAAMTKAASYLLWNDAFSMVRSYLLRNMTSMISDSTGIPPSFARAAGFIQETHGTFRGSLLRASQVHNRDFRRLWESQPRRKLPFRYGYMSAKQAHLVVTKRPAKGVNP